MKLCTLGLGYIGLPTSIMFAKYGVNVIGVDVREDVIESLNNGEIHIEEPGLQEALVEVLNNNQFKASLYPEKADAFIIAVPSPNNDDLYKSCDLTYVLNAVDSIIPFLEKGNVVIIESTIAPRSMDDVIKPAIEKNGFKVGQDIFLVHCPERVLPGQIMHELVHNNRIIGGITPACTEAGVKVYRTLVEGELIKTDAKTAEMSKLMENTYRDVNIALANELAKVCNALEINVLDVIDMANKHPRVNIHSPGPGVGGHCLAVDPYFIISKAPDTAKIIELSRRTNLSMPQYIVDSINQLMESVNGSNITIFGVTYKGNVDDIRESPAIEIYHLLKNENKYNLRAYDPHVNLDFVTQDIEEATANSDLIVILAEHDEFKELDYKKLNLMKNKMIFDTKNIVNNRAAGYEYITLGNLFNYLKTRETVEVN